MKLNLLRGLFRLWIVFSGLFVIWVIVEDGGSVVTAFERMSPRKDWLGNVLVPAECPPEEFMAVSDPRQGGLCWHTVKDYRRSHSEAEDKDAALTARLYSEANIPIVDAFDAWVKFFEVVGIALGVPLAVLLLGLSLIWAVSGFFTENQLASVGLYIGMSPILAAVVSVCISWGTSFVLIWFMLPRG